MGNWILQLVIAYVLSQIAKFGAALDWASLKAEANSYVAKFVPAFLLPTVDGIVDSAIDAIQAALADDADLTLIVDDLAAENWAKALSDLEAMLQKVVGPVALSVAAATKGVA